MRPDYERRSQAYARLRVLQLVAETGNVTVACALCGWSRKRYYKWRNRYDGTLDSLLDRSRRPRSHPRQLPAADHQLILRVARRHRRAGLHRLHWLLCAHHGFTSSVGAVYKALRRLGFYAPRKRRTPSQSGAADRGHSSPRLAIPRGSAHSAWRWTGL